MSLDVFDLCTPALQERLKPMRNKFKAEEERKLEKKMAAVQSGVKPMETDAKKTTFPYSFEDDIGSNNSGYYELSAVLTHRGRSSSSGHYVSWVRQPDDTWVMCDDDNMSAVHVDDVLKLSGGGDWHCAYVLLYSPKQLVVEEDTTVKIAETVPDEAGEVKV